MRPPSKHHVAEWERHGDLLAFEPTCWYPALAALGVARAVADRFGFPLPYVFQSRRAYVTSTCSWMATAPHRTTIVMRRGFSPGELLHELAHAWCFHRYGNHNHGQLFVSAMDDLCHWFRLEENAQKLLFP